MVHNEHVPLAFGLTLAAAASTGFGAAVVFFASQANQKLLAASLGASGGVMLFISFVEIFCVKTLGGFEEAGYTEGESRRYGFITFFGGMFLIWLLDKMVHLLLFLAKKSDDADRRPDIESATEIHEDKSGCPGLQKSVAHEPEGCELTVIPYCIDECAYSGRSLSETNTPARGAATDSAAYTYSKTDKDSAIMTSPSQDGITVAGDGLSSSQAEPPAAQPVHVDEEAEALVMLASSNGRSTASLIRTGLLAALAIGLHNFPEGIATFLGTLAEPSTGIVIAIAIILHNIPEGVIVSIPVFYATGCRWKAFCYGALTGFTEPVGALIGWLIVRQSDMSPLGYAVMFGLISGLMVYIVLSELLPQAYAYDPEDKVTTKGVVGGMIVMALSLIMFTA